MSLGEGFGVGFRGGGAVFWWRGGKGEGGGRVGGGAGDRGKLPFSFAPTFGLSL